MAVAIRDKGETVYCEGFAMADRIQDVAVEPQTIFNIGSISKVFVATAIMLLVDEGKVDLDEPVVSYLPNFTMRDERYREITSRMLLNHTSGLPGTYGWNAFSTKYDPDLYPRFLESLSQSNLKAAPGGFAAYCNDGFTLAEMLVATVSGLSYEDFLTKRLFGPLSLKQTGFSVGRVSSEQSSAHYYTPTGSSGPLQVVSLLGAGGLSSNAVELCQFTDAFSSEAGLLSPASLAEMLKPQTTDFHKKVAGLPFGLGWDFAYLTPFADDSLRLFGKSGGTGEYNSFLYSIPSLGISIAMLSTAGSAAFNTAYTTYDMLVSYLSEAGLIDGGTGVSSMTKAAQDVKTLPEAEPILAETSQLAGFYCSTGGAPNKVIIDETAHTLSMYDLSYGSETLIFSAIHNNGSFYSDDGSRYDLHKTEEGQFITKQARFGIQSIIAQKIEIQANPQQLSIPIHETIWLRRNVYSFESITAVAAGTHALVSYQIDELPGYVDLEGLHVIDAPDHAGMPVTAMRDLMEIQLYEREGSMWLWHSGAHYMPVELATNLQTGDNKLTIGAEGLNEWGRNEVDLIATFSVPDSGRVLVFSSGVLYDSLTDEGPVFIPEGSLIEVVGEPEDEFVVSLV